MSCSSLSLILPWHILRAFNSYCLKTNVWNVSILFTSFQQNRLFLESKFQRGFDICTQQWKHLLEFALFSVLPFLDWVSNTCILDCFSLLLTWSCYQEWLSYSFIQVLFERTLLKFGKQVYWIASVVFKVKTLYCMQHSVHLYFHYISLI